ncbi:hypothetical protein ASPBRDRAFT_195731 [Aspergillus brasiliensis CBS 101740]|uniref:protein-histidine N-methyltransferase n=1 Tax=Aspergillus brasiliensis (strain CBS 101740 / IMI 381727 / IBT 21946) TaxID=767769 RepID=A0A1L9UIX4_ASPBC|nr:hypothetical protein ASPBRDRAFT_195731 [Aspergillus brasiliensis CBS 101740]
MTSTFSFGFAGDDIDIDDTEMNETHDTNNDQNIGAGSALPELIPAKKHDVAEWIPTLPSQISFNKLRLPTKTAATSQHANKQLTLARRDIFDIRAQLMAEDTPDENNEELIAGLEKGDIKPNFYEGGFKTWECAVDLAKVLVDADELDVSSSTGDKHIIELGAGTAIPSLSLFAQLLSAPAASAPGQQKKTHFTFADYNSAVLRLVTFPNLLLTWHHYTTQSSSASEEEVKEEDELLDITPTLIQSFQEDLSARGITISFISGAWSPAFVDLVFSSTSLHQQQESPSQTLVLASETIYSPASLGAFSETLVALLRRATTTTASTPGQQSAALVAAKKVYFGVGGGVDEFLAVLGGVASNEGVKVEVQERLDVKSEGVGRVVLGVRCA